MRYPGPVVAGHLLRRYRRFLADFVLGDGSVVTAHCANPGSMRTCLEPGAIGWLTRADAVGRRLAYTWQVIDVGRARIFVNPALANAVVAEAIGRGRLPELAGYSELRREVPVGNGARLDLLLRRGRDRCFVEIKSATLGLGAGLVGFPDAGTARGGRHRAERERLAAAGDRAVQLFFVARSDARALAPADAIDPAYGAALRRAVAHGGEVLAYRASITARTISGGPRLPVFFPARPPQPGTIAPGTPRDRAG